MVLFDRFIIIHLGLLPCADGNSRGFDESASRDELSEHILFFFDGRQQDHDDYSDHGVKLTKGKCIYNDDSVIRFAGLCHALYNLPESLNYRSGTGVRNDGNERPHKDYAREVNLSTCTLIFIPLEESQTSGLFAVAQCPKSHIDKPQAELNIKLLRDYFHIAHELFQLTKCGIHNCLMSLDQSELSSIIRMDTIQDNFASDKTSYPGMDELYNKHRQLQKLSEKSCANGKSDILFHEMEKLVKHIDSIYSILPIQYIRNDLKSFYTWICVTCTGIEAIIKHTFPPITIIRQEPSLKNQKVSSSSLLHTMKSIVERKNNTITSTAIQPYHNLMGFSAFENDHHVCTSTKPHYSLSIQQLQLINRYLSTGKSASNIHPKSSFVQPPSKITLLRHGEEMIIPNFARIWLPMLFVDGSVPFKAAMYKCGDMDLIFYITIVEDGSHQIQRNNLMSSIDFQIAQTLMHLDFLIRKEISIRIQNPVGNALAVSKGGCLENKGFRFVYIDRVKSVTTIFLGDNKETKKTALTTILFGFFSPKGTLQVGESNEQLYSNATKLLHRVLTYASPWNLNSFYPVNEIIPEAHGGMSEFCYRLPYNKGWLVALKNKEKQREVYMVLDEFNYCIKDILVQVEAICASDISSHFPTMS